MGFSTASSDFKDMGITSNVLKAVVGEVNTYGYACTVYTDPVNGDGDELDKQYLGKAYIVPDYADRRAGRDWIVKCGAKAAAITPADVSKVVVESNGAMSVFTEKWERDDAGNVLLARKRYIFHRLAPEQQT